MSEYPECPFCHHILAEPVPKSIDGSIKIRCPSCEQRYEYIPEAGSFPLEDDLGVMVKKGGLSRRITTDSATLEGDMSLSKALLIGGLCCCSVIVIIPVVVAMILALFG
ncbi:MAG: hypothetical protein ACFFBL_10920 [Promethearchaeota archaeon]